MGDTGSNGSANKGRGTAFGVVLSLLISVGVIGGFVGLGLLGPTIRAAVLAAACDVSMCSAAGMTTAGWLIPAVPLALGVACAAGLRRWGRAGRVIMISALVLAGMIALVFVPGKRRSMDDLVKGPGADQFIDGVLWALGGAGAGLLLLFILAIAAKGVSRLDRTYNIVAPVAAAALLIAALPIAISTAEPAFTRAVEIFPERLTMNGDVLTRTSAADRRGCAGVLPEDGILNGGNCLLTVTVAYTTDDSDAVATVNAVLYPDFDTARAVRDAIPDGVRPVGAPEQSRTVVSGTFSWVLIGNAAHADGRPIAAGDRHWVLWPLRQVSYRFIGVQGGLIIDPDPEDEIRPRTL